MTQYARISEREARLSSEFGEKMARKWFSEETLAKVPLLKSGPNKGKMKGTLRWKKCEEGGWVSTARATISGSGSGYVERRVGQVIYKAIVVDEKMIVELDGFRNEAEKAEDDAKWKKQRLEESIYHVEAATNQLRLAISQCTRLLKIETDPAEIAKLEKEIAERTPREAEYAAYLERLQAELKECEENV